METYAETKGEKPFDWNAFLDRAAVGNISYTEYVEAVSLASGWITCACGNQCKGIARDPRGRPFDIILRALGNQFAFFISERSWASARKALEKIEVRSAELLEKTVQEQENNGRLMKDALHWPFGKGL